MIPSRSRPEPLSGQSCSCAVPVRPTYHSRPVPVRSLSALSQSRPNSSLIYPSSSLPIIFFSFLSHFGLFSLIRGSCSHPVPPLSLPVPSHFHPVTSPSHPRPVPVPSPSRPRPVPVPSPSRLRPASVPSLFPSLLIPFPICSRAEGVGEAAE